MSLRFLHWGVYLAVLCVGSQRLFSPKGWNTIAQGNALGEVSGPRALPWAIVLEPFRLREMANLQTESPVSRGKEQNASLLGTRWDFSDRSLAGWRWKDNARVSLAEDGGNKAPSREVEMPGPRQAGMPALRLQSGFEPYDFTWVARHFEPRSMDGVAHIRFRVRGDGSGHSLQLHLGAPSPQNRGRWLYYVNSRQAVKLDFAGWREVSVDVARFDTPGNGLRDRDLAQVSFLEFTVNAQRKGDSPIFAAKRLVATGDALGAAKTGTVPRDAKPLDILLDDIQFVGLSQEEIAAAEREREERARLVSELTAALAPIEKRLALLRDQLDKAAAEGKYTDVARVYWTALNWTAQDLKRCLRCEEMEVVKQAKPILADLQKCVEESEPRLSMTVCHCLPQGKQCQAHGSDTASGEAVAHSGGPRGAMNNPGQRVLDKVLAKAPEEGDPLDSTHNPHFKSTIEAIRPQSRKERWWPKGQEGYRSISDAWTFRRLGDDGFAEVWAMTRPKSPLRHHPMLLRNALNIFDAVAHQHADGDFNINRTAVHGRDMNINRFCLAPALDAWCELQRAYPELLPPARRAEVEAGLKRLVDFQVKEYGLARLARRPDLRFQAYPNMDVHYILIMERAHELWKDPQYAKERDAFVKLLESAVYPMGAFTYVNTQNECFVYHALDVLYAARYWKLSGDAKVLELLKKTAPYYPYNVEPAGMPEYYTDACWKHYWGGGDACGPSVIAALCNDPLNQRVAETCGAIWGYGRGHTGAIAAEFWKPIASKPLPDNYTIYDTNVQGPRGRYGNWSFAGNGRNYGVGFQGKDTFVGCMLTDPERRPLPLDAALQVVTAEVRLSHTGNHWEGGRCYSAEEKLTTTLGEDFGSLAVRYKLSRPQWHYKYDELLPWEGTQVWYLSRNRLIGLVALEATADETRAAVHGRIRLGLQRELEPAPELGDNSWRYGRLVVRLHGHNYAKVVAKPSETTFQDSPSRYRSTEITLLDPVSVAAGEQGNVLFRKGTRYWFLVEAFPSENRPVEVVHLIDREPLVGFRFLEAGREVAVLHNPTDRAVETDLPLAEAGTKLTIYEDQGEGGWGKAKRAPEAGDPGASLRSAPTTQSRRVRLEPDRHLVIVAAREK
jgi:hypothetical protein